MAPIVALLVSDCAVTVPLPVAVVVIAPSLVRLFADVIWPEPDNVCVVPAASTSITALSLSSIVPEESNELNAMADCAGPVRITVEPLRETNPGVLWDASANTVVPFSKPSVPNARFRPPWIVTPLSAAGMTPGAP